VDNTSDANKPISALTAAALTTLSNTVTNQGTAIENKVDNTTLQTDYYNKTQVDDFLTQKQNSLIVAGNDAAAYKLIDSSQNVRSLKVQSPLTLTLNTTDKSLTLGGPADITANGDNTTANGYSLLQRQRVEGSEVQRLHKPDRHDQQPDHLHNTKNYKTSWTTRQTATTSPTSLATSTTSPTTPPTRTTRS
jgi:hypothetical protein